MITTTCANVSGVHNRDWCQALTGFYPTDTAVPGNAVSWTWWIWLKICWRF